MIGLRLWLASVLLAFLSGCSLSEKAEIAKSAAQRFHEQVASGQDDAIYDGADPAWRTSVDRDTNRKYFARIRRKMGDCSGESTSGPFFNSNPSGTFVTLNYNRICAAGAMSESFRWRIRDGSALLVSYMATSPLLLTD